MDGYWNGWVKQGGHGIAEKDIEKRYVDTFHNLKFVLPKCDLAAFYDNTFAVLFEEPSNLLKQGLRELAVYNAVITAVAAGKIKMSEIASTIGIETGLCTKYLANLITLGIIKRETPVTERNSKRSIYLIEDQFFRLWYIFVSKNISARQAEWSALICHDREKKSVRNVEFTREHRR